MYEHINVEQNSPEWFSSRAGKWTASLFAKCVSPTGKLSKSAAKVNDKLIMELITGNREPYYQSEAMARGIEIEPEALQWVNDNTEYNFEPVGFFDSGKGYGCSPDAVDFKKETGIEIKCPIEKTHLKYLKDNKIPTKYYSQVQGQLMVSGFKQWLFVSYFPEGEQLQVMVERDEPFIELLRSELERHVNLMEEGVNEVTDALQG